MRFIKVRSQMHWSAMHMWQDMTGDCDILHGYATTSIYSEVKADTELHSEDSRASDSGISRSNTQGDPHNKRVRGQV